LSAWFSSKEYGSSVLLERPMSIPAASYGFFLRANSFAPSGVLSFVVLPFNLLPAKYSSHP
jgi:hypothetical protein